MDKSLIIGVDIETTGLNMQGDDEILQLSILDGNYKILFNEYIKPTNKKSWPHTEKIHGITPAMVEDKQLLEFHKEKIEAILKDAEVIVGYNHRSFDMPFLNAKGIEVPKNKEYCDIMNEFSRRINSSTRKKLTECAGFYGYENMAELAHDSLEDVKATLFCYHKMVEQNPILQACTLDNHVVTQISSVEEKRQKLKDWKILSQKSKGMKPVLYKDRFTKREWICEVIGFVEYSSIIGKETLSYETAIIEVDEKVKWVHSAYLKQMQDKGFFEIEEPEEE